MRSRGFSCFPQQLGVEEGFDFGDPSPRGIAEEICPRVKPEAHSPNFPINGYGATEGSLEGSYSHGGADQTMEYNNMDGEEGAFGSDGLPPHGSVSLDSPMFAVDANGGPTNEFSLSCKYAVAQNQNLYEDFSNGHMGSSQSLSTFPSLSCLPSVPLLNVEALQKQFSSSSSTPPFPGVGRRTRQKAGALEMRAALNIKRQQGGKNLNWVQGVRSPSPSVVSTPQPHVQLPEQLPEHVTPVRRGPGRPFGAKTVNRTPGVKSGRPFGTKKPRCLADDWSVDDDWNKQEKSKKTITRRKAVQVEVASFVRYDDEVEVLSEYDLKRRQTIAENNALLMSLGIQNEVQIIRPPPARMLKNPIIQRTAVNLKDVCVPGMYEQPCSGWVYDMKKSRYLKEVIMSQRYVLGKGVSALGVYQLNGLFGRYEVVRPLSEEVVTAYFMISQTHAKSVYSTLIPDKHRIFRNADSLGRHLLQYLRINPDDRNAGLLDIGNLKYCQGKGDMLYGPGLYIKYFKKDDFDAVRKVESRLDAHYKLLEESTFPLFPAGYYYHDFDDVIFSGNYNCVHVAPKNAHLRSKSGSDDESRDYR